MNAKEAMSIVNQSSMSVAEELVNESLPFVHQKIKEAATATKTKAASRDVFFDLDSVKCSGKTLEFFIEKMSSTLREGLFKVSHEYDQDGMTTTNYLKISW